MPPKTRGRAKGKGKAAGQNAVPDVYRDMLEEAIPSQLAVPERPLKRRKVGSRDAVVTASKAGPSKPSVAESHDEAEDDEDVEFEDVMTAPTSLNGEDPEEDANVPQQTAYRDSDEETDESDADVEIDWENVNFTTKDDEPSGDLELTLTRPAPQRQTVTPRRKTLTQGDKNLRLEAHKLHLLCLLSHVHRRNEWCNDSAVQDSLRPLLNRKMLSFLRPRKDLSQFSQAESLKKGLDMVAVLWRTKFQITKRGWRRALWADNEDDIKNYKLPGDADASYERADFRKAATELKGSRDSGAQLFCALLRSVDVEARLVCSLQPLSFTTGGPSMPKPPKPKARPTIPPPPIPSPGPSNSTLLSNPRSRLGHPGAAGYNIPTINPAPLPPPIPKAKPIRESPFPIFWVEVLDSAHQKWIPIDPLVTETISKPRSFEPPLTDKENALSYVLAFSPDSSARDVTRRYSKAPNSKTRKQRIESTPGGQKWWNKVLSHYSRGWKTDVEQIEDGELAALEGREPMPKNVQDFKDHPVYALERHLRRNEVIVAERESGKVATGNANASGIKKLENVYRRKDVHICKSADAWYRLGREVKMGEEPVKVVPSRNPRKNDFADEEEREERAGTALYTQLQTELFIPPPIVNGRVPKNSFGNIDIYVPSMVPKGGVHISAPESVYAAKLLGIDFAAALTGFEFRGRHGTAVLRGVVVAKEYGEAVEEVVKGFREEREREIEEEKKEVVLKLWRKWLLGLRIKETVDGYFDDEEEEDDAEVDEEDRALDEKEKAEPEMEDGGFVRDDEEEYEGGFVKEVEDDDGGEEGGFVREDEIMDSDDSSELSETYTDDEYDDDMGGGFIPE
ncbi:putative dna repair protein [Botrytis fragariae]|uniref:Putative dna repair protein n=1 Tax=Botrytis fragariae TaxID=1964551 RepID=A0A8H6ANL4_9HELO|nr:putative dna repair protein [Botrytis fragariae]KAF5870520.1 putative dna repair protein [Botrytis fragariae]